jgi:hypothetical protein
MSLNFSHIKADTFDQVNFELKVNDVVKNLTGAVIRMQLRKTADDATPALSLTSVGGAGITITSPTTGLFRINAQIIDIPVFDYEYDIEIRFADNTVKTYVQGIFSITQEITR